MVVDGKMEGSLQRFMRETTASTELQPRAHWWSYPVPSPQSTPCTGATNGSDLSMDQDVDTHEGVLEGSEDLYLDTGGPGPSLPDSRLCGRHFMAKTELRRRCKLCMKTESRGSAAYQSKISLVCRQCNVFLHFECFEEYHTRVNAVSRWVGGA
jgi:hypothetical protein